MAGLWLAYNLPYNWHMARHESRAKMNFVNKQHCIKKQCFVQVLIKKRL
jgi:hypothetical protein